MQILPGKRIFPLYITGLLLALGLLGWFFVWPSHPNSQDTVISIPAASTVDPACQAVYRQVKMQGFVGRRIMARSDFDIEKAILITGQDAKSRYNLVLTTPDDAHFCYILVRGNIEVGSPLSNKVATYLTGHAIFDPVTLMQMEIGSGEYPLS